MKLNFKTFGSGEPLIILHGLMGSLDNWQTLAKSYAEHFTVFILDLRNHGKSPHSEAFSYQLMTDDLLAFCEQQFIFKTNIIGHSMGGESGHAICS
jgi:esterase